MICKKRKSQCPDAIFPKEKRPIIGFVMPAYYDQNGINQHYILSIV
jgi:hypothetical protein